MNSSLNNKRRRRYYARESFLDKLFAFMSALAALLLTALESIHEFFSRPEIALVIKGVCIIGALSVIVGAVGGIENGTLMLADAIIRIFASLAVGCLIFKAIGE